MSSSPSHIPRESVDVARGLQALGRTAPDKTVAMGGSAGGLLVGAVANMAPETFHAIVAYVPFVDVVSTMLDDTIPLTTFEYDEWGNPNDKDAYEYMLSYSPYDNVVAQDYPHLLIITGLHDSQVHVYDAVGFRYITPASTFLPSSSCLSNSSRIPSSTSRFMTGPCCEHDHL